MPPNLNAGKKTTTRIVGHRRPRTVPFLIRDPIAATLLISLLMLDDPARTQKLKGSTAPMYYSRQTCREASKDGLDGSEYEVLEQSFEVHSSRLGEGASLPESSLLSFL